MPAINLEELLANVEETDLASIAHTIFSRLRTDKGHETVRQRWERIFTVETEDDLVHLIFMVRQNLTVLDAQLEAIERLPEPARKIQTAIVAGLANLTTLSSLPNAMAQYSSSLNQDKLNNLFMVSAFIKDEYPRPHLPDPFVKAMLQNISELRSEIEKARISESLRRYLLRHVRHLEVTMKHARILGINILSDVFVRTAAALRTVPAGNADTVDSLSRIGESIGSIQSDKQRAGHGGASNRQRRYRPFTY